MISVFLRDFIEDGVSVDPVRGWIEKVGDDRTSEVFPEMFELFREDRVDSLDLRLRVDESLLDRCLESVEIGSTPDVSEIEKESFYLIEDRGFL